MWKLALFAFAAVIAVGLCGVPMPGGVMDGDPNEEGVQQALGFAVLQHNKGTNDIFLHRPGKVLKVQTQVVAGMKYIITVEMAKTLCRKDRSETCDSNDADLAADQAAQRYRCTFSVWSRPWLSEMRLLEEKCV